MLCFTPAHRGRSETLPAFDGNDARLLLQAIGQAQAHGLDPKRFDIDGVERLVASSDAAERERGWVRLRSATIAYARALRGQTLASSAYPTEWAIRPAPYLAEQDLGAALEGHRVSAWLASLPPADPRYARLVEAHARYAAIVAKGGWSSLDRTAGPGQKGAAVLALRRRLAIEDPLLADEGPAGERYDEPLRAAVVRAEVRYGLEQDGVAGQDLIAALNTPAEARLGQIRASLERWRWMPRTLAAERLEVNIPAAWLDDYEGGKPVMSMRAIVGRKKDPTPSFQDQVESVVFNPPWNVPPSIARKELWPKQRAHPGYLASHGFTVKAGGGLRQRPGPKSALGKVKFDLPNSFGVYLHDTPTRQLFEQDERDLSHGCMRLEQPIPLAKRLLSTNATWTGEHIDQEIASGHTIRAQLTQPVAVYVLYFTAFVDEQGQVGFRPDVYGWDQKLLSGL